MARRTVEVPLPSDRAVILSYSIHEFYPNPLSLSKCWFSNVSDHCLATIVELDGLANSVKFRHSQA